MCPPAVPPTGEAPLGVVALQGGFHRHCEMITRLGATARPVRQPRDLAGIGGLVIPGGESTTIGMLMERFGLIQAVRAAALEGLPILGTCAGAILLARTIEGSDQPRLGLMDITLKRNAYGRQIESFEAPLWGPLAEPGSLPDLPAETGPLKKPDPPAGANPRGESPCDTSSPFAPPLTGVFIRAPRITARDEQVEVLAFLDNEAVAVRQGNLLALTFHPELTEDPRAHHHFLAICRRATPWEPDAVQTARAVAVPG
ncbi:hypothetical protein AU468_02050 [Alkalispirochaeta sphaeroplastigenens]|uniref:Pyridoxal 5'-phosphate synthase subunit PdxT n=1 Tax=Alkalispirochaeta sphaeroplastigenens TaxID=1187066 RepID=A0A2S4K0K2_9SPIO|nr:pyridoxal 5'-phosphate synthase glutaminase subunit PdxT [Alkalispirochaeta sphaeroplastigenens]POR05293.1 hypothetical protein AU468_02050 [Alkalispirochaeta sphaeroplastigenens]